MKKRKRLLSMVLAAYMAIFLLCGTTLAADREYNGEYWITFDMEGHVKWDSWNWVNQYGDFTMPDAPELTGYEFAGWTDGTNTYQPGEVIWVDRNMEFHALWTQTHPFTDVDKEDACFGDVMYVYEKGLMTGTTAATFAPDGTINRATIWTVLGRMAGADVNGGSPWYDKAREWAVRTGVSDGAAPGREISRQELAAMLYRQAGSPAVDLKQGGWEAYIEAWQVADWAGNAMVWALQTGVIAGGKIEPTELVSRAELAAALVSFCELTAES